MAFFEQPPQLTDYIIGKMKLTKREGDYDGFLAAKGVPYAIRLLKQIPVCLLYTSPSPRDQRGSRMPSSA